MNNILRNIINIIDRQSRNSLLYSDVKTEWQKSLSIDDRLLQSLALGFITFIYPDNPEQSKESAKVGETTVERMRVILGKTPQETLMSVHSNFSGGTASPLALPSLKKAVLMHCHSDEEW